MSRRLISALVAVTAFVTPLALVSAPANAAAKNGQLCKAADVGTSQGGLTCGPDAKGKNRWSNGGAAAPATTAKATATTKAPTNTKATGNTKAPAAAPASSGTVEAVKGRFCKKADDGKKSKDAKGVLLTCKADAAGKNRWTA